MSKNIILMGPPGCGKTSIGKKLAHILKLDFLDIDDYMEAINDKTVGSFLTELGDEKFLDFEAEQTLNIKVKNHVISTTGSNPLRPHAMQHLHKNGIVVYIDRPAETIEKHLNDMKVDRIVGMQNNSLAEILAWRKENFYDTYPADLHLKIKTQENRTEILAKILKELLPNQYHSTRGDLSRYTFSESLLQGLAPDQGLLVPTYLPYLYSETLLDLSQKSYQARAIKIFELFNTDFSQAEIEEIVTQAYGQNFDTPAIAPVKHLQNKQYLLELWHGPTAAFKDMALQFKPLCFAKSIQKENQARKSQKKAPKHYLILTATSGDTGKAALEGYRDRAQIKIAVLYPQDGVSVVQKQQMVTQQGNNVAVCGIAGNFDDAQNAVKTIFQDTAFTQKLKAKNWQLSSANSINWGRILPQIFYYVSAYCDLLNKKIIQKRELIDIAVPTGNFGNILAAYYARCMGVPIDKLICASNSNNVLTEFLQTGTYDLTKRKLKKTPSPSMNILISSNLERLLYHITQDSRKIKTWMAELQTQRKFTVDAQTQAVLQSIFKAGYCDNTETLQTIKAVFDATGELLDPHTAVVQNVTAKYQKALAESERKPIILAATAHWAKFGNAVYRALKEIPFDAHLEDTDEFALLEKISQISNSHIPPNLTNLKTQPIRHPQTCSKEIEKIKTFLEDFMV